MQACGSLHPAATVDANGRMLHSWRTPILPYLEQGPLYATIDPSKPWDDPANAQARSVSLLVFHRPSSTEPPGTTTYLASAGPDACLAAHAGRPLPEITDGTGSTLAVLDAAPADAVPWTKPADADAALLARIASAKAQHRGGFNAVCVDGSARFIERGTPDPALRALWTIAGGEPLSADPW